MVEPAHHFALTEWRITWNDVRPLVQAMETMFMWVVRKLAAFDQYDAISSSETSRTPSTAVMGEPGQVVSAGQTVITLADSGETEIAVSVPEQDAGYLTIGQQAKVTLWAGPRVSLEGHIREIAGRADPASRTYAVRIAVSGSEIVRLGMTASVALRMDGEAAGVVVPLTALTESEGGPAVFVVDPTNEAVRKAPVSVGGMAEDGVRIADGLHAGEVVVTAGVQFLRDGMRVRIPDERQHARSRSLS